MSAQLSRRQPERRTRPRTLQARWQEEGETLNIILSEAPPPNPVNPQVYSKHTRRKSLVLKAAQWYWEEAFYLI